MRGVFYRITLSVAALGAAALASACGTVATPEWAAEAQGTRIALASTAEHLTAIAPTATFTPLPTSTPTLIPSPTLLPPTATPVPPTETPPPPTATPAQATSAPAAEDPIAVALAAGDPANGQVVFGTAHTLPDGSQWACATCHSVTPDELRLIGPGQWNIAIRAATRVEGQNAVEYIHNSIVNPQDFIAPTKEGDPPWALPMPQGWGEVLTEQELNDVIAYLLTLHD